MKQSEKEHPLLFFNRYKNGFLLKHVPSTCLTVHRTKEATRCCYWMKQTPISCTKNKSKLEVLCSLFYLEVTPNFKLKPLNPTWLKEGFHFQCQKKSCKLAHSDLLASFIKLEVALITVSSGLRKIIRLPSPYQQPQNRVDKRHLCICVQKSSRSNLWK